MSNKTNYSEKLRAVFLAAIMISSIFAGTMALSGSAAAVSAPASANDVEYEEGIAFQGQNLVGELDSSATSATLRSVESFDAEGQIEGTSFVEELDLGNYDGNSDPTPEKEFEVDTDDLEAGDYIVVDGSNDVELIRENTFEVTVQDLSAEFDSDDLPALTDDYEDSLAELDVSSSRNGYSYNVSAGGDLERDELFNIFMAAQLDGVSVSDGDVSEAPSPSGSAEWDVTDDGALEVVDGDGNVLSDASSSAELSYSSPWNALQNANEINFGLFNTVTQASIENTHDGDVLETSNTISAGTWSVGLYDSNQDDYEDKVVITSGDVEKDVSFAGIDGGDYTFDFDVTDTEAAASAEASAGEEDLAASFDEGVSQTAAGDIAEFTLTLEDTDETWVQIGGEDSDFVDVLYLEADDASESMTVQINTRTLGSGVGTSDVYDEGDNVDTIESYVHDDGFSSDASPSTNLFENDGNTQSFNKYLDEMGIIDENAGETYKGQLARPLQATDYEVTVAGTDVDNALFDSDAGGEANDELASKVIELQQPEIGDITIHTAPEDNADDTSNVSELVDAATQREEVAIDDRLVVQVEATGLYGALVAGTNNDDTDWDRLDDGMDATVLHNLVEKTDPESIDFEIQAGETTGNQDPLEIDLQDSSDSEVYVVLDEDNGQFFVVADTSSDSAFANGDAPDEDTTFTAELEYDADNGDERFEYADGPNPAPFSGVKNPGTSDYHNYPYLLQGETLSGSSEFDLAPRSIDFENMNVDDVLEAENVEDAQISGTTNVAPGTDGELRVSSTDASSSFRIGQSFEVGAEGEVSAQFDLGDQETGDQFETAFRIGGEAIDTVDSTVVEEGTLSEDAPEEDEEETEEEETEEDTDESEDDTSEEDTSEDDTSEEDTSDEGETSEEETDEQTPGFGAIVALVAVLGAALLASRRQN